MSIDATTIGHARTFLFVPGDRPERFDKAAAAGADLVILDLEDAVPPAEKEAARANVVRWLAEGGVALVRVNAIGSPWHDADLAALPDTAVMVPKADDPAALTAIAGAGRPVVALVETALGIERAGDVLAVAGVARAALGHIDLAAELGVDPHEPGAFAYARARLVMASAAAGIAPPVDGVTTALDDEAQLVADVARAKAVGFGGKLCIHPRQIAATHAALAPTEVEVAWARDLLARAGEGAGAVDGHMVDRPVLLRAQRLVDLADRSTASTSDRKA